MADSGNSKVSGSSAIYEIPYEGGSGLNPNDQFIVATGVPMTSPVAIDTSGNLYYTNVYPADAGASVLELTRNNASLGSVTVGSTGPATLNVVFNTAVTPATIGFVTNNGVFASATGSTCAANTTYAEAKTCAVNVSFKPAAPGLANGALVLAMRFSEHFSLV